MAVAWVNVSRADEAYDVVIRHGRVMDPESGFDGIADVAIRGDRIVAIARALPAGKREIDAKGLVVAPGFIDLHAHDIDAYTSRLHALDGVTTVLELEEGVLPVASWYRLREHRSVINYGAAVSHFRARAVAVGGLDPMEFAADSRTAVAKVGGWEGAWATAPLAPGQLERIEQLLRQGLDEGGIGFGFHLATTPGADRDEMRALYAFSAEQAVPNFIHIRSVGSVTPTEAVQEVIDAARDTKASIHMMHINSSGMWETPKMLTLIDDAQRSGLDVTTDVYPYTASHSSMDDPRVSKQGLALFRIDFSDLELVDTGERLTERTFDLYKRTKPKAELVVHTMRQSDVDLAVKHPMVMIGSDGGAFTEGKGHPRGAGTFSQVLGRYVREQGALSLMGALAKMTVLPARKLEASVSEMRLRGRLRPGMIADITVFDPRHVRDRATYRNPIQPSAGIAYVLVAGTPVVERYRFQDARFPGRAIKGRGRPTRDAAPAATAQVDNVESALQRVLDAAVKDPASGYHGAVLRVTAGDKVWSVASGIGDLRTQARMDPADRFRCGSILKPFIATVILQLVEAGDLKLDDKLTSLLPRRYWEGFEYAADITLEMLLDHRSGIGDWTDDDLYAEVVPHLERIWNVEELLDRAGKHDTKFRPGEAYAYNNTEYNLLGQIIEQVTGVSWRQNVRERILVPLALNDTWLPEPGERRAPPRHARGYEIVGGQELDLTEVDPSMAGAAGGHALISTTADLTTFMRALLAGRLFKHPETLAAMLDGRDTTGPSPGGPIMPRRRYGLGIGEYDLRDGSVAYGHTGGTAGFGSLILHIPARNLSVSAMINKDDGGALAALVTAAVEAVHGPQSADTPNEAGRVQ